MTKSTHFHLLTPSLFISSGKFANPLFLISPPTIRGRRVSLCSHLQSLSKALEHLQYLLDYLINTPLSPSKQCWFMEDKRSTHVDLPADNYRRCIRLTQYCFKWGGGGYNLYCHGKCFIEWVFQGLLEEIVRVPPFDQFACSVVAIFWEIHSGISDLGSLKHTLILGKEKLCRFMVYRMIRLWNVYLLLE